MDTSGLGPSQNRCTLINLICVLLFAIHIYIDHMFIVGLMQNLMLLMLKLWQLKANRSKLVSTFCASWTLCYTCWVWHGLTLVISPRPQCVVRCCLEEEWRYSGVSRSLSEVLGIRSHQSVVPERNGAWSLVIIPRYSDVSVNIAMCTLNK
jgi:hypothetical protein